MANQEVTVREAELLRAICDMLDCPLPPLVVGEVEGPWGKRKDNERYRSQGGL